jgi:hypothetical protein
MISAPVNSNTVARSIAVAPSSYDETQSSKLLEGELLDLYGAILIVVPVAFFFKSLWF